MSCIDHTTRCFLTFPLLSPYPPAILSSIVNQGDRVAQLILERIYTPEVIEVAELDSTDRGAGGFGSTGGFGQVVGEAVQGVQGVVGRVVEGVQEVGQALGQSAGSAVDVVKQAGEEAK